MALSKILLPDSRWEVVAEGHGFTDAACVDAQGVFYFSGRPDGKSGIFRVGEDGRPAPLTLTAPDVSGLAFGPDGRLYGCRWGHDEVFVFETDGTRRILARARHANDLIVRSDGALYFTAEDGLYFLPPEGAARRVDDRIQGPNGLALSPGHPMLAVSEHNGHHVWTFQTDPVKGVAFGDTYMTMRPPADGSVCRGDGMTVDAAGRWYVTSHAGIQMFDATGRRSGVIASPGGEGGHTHVAFAGPRRDWLYLCRGGSVHRRLMKAVGSKLFP